jgi:hypothetical protein
MNVAGRIALYKYAVLLPQQHQPLLDFHMCLKNTQNALVATSPLRVFSRTWPQLVAFKIESFLLPTKRTRRTMQQVISYFNETLNEFRTFNKTQLHVATSESDVYSVKFLLEQEGILVDTLSHVYAEDINDQMYETPLNCAERIVAGTGAVSAYRLAANSFSSQILEMLRDAGGTAWEIRINSEEWFTGMISEENEWMETTPGEY